MGTIRKISDNYDESNILQICYYSGIIGSFNDTVSITKDLCAKL